MSNDETDTHWISGCEKCKGESAILRKGHGMIYLASPYNHEDPAVRESRYDAAMKACADLLIAGEHVFSPIVHCHELAKRYELPPGFEFWRDYDHAFLRLCDRMVVLKLDGWKESRGVTAEIELAKELAMQIEFMEAA